MLQQHHEHILPFTALSQWEPLGLIGTLRDNGTSTSSDAAKPPALDLLHHVIPFLSLACSVFAANRTLGSPDASYLYLKKKEFRT